jgi:hypothetical protein
MTAKNWCAISKAVKMIAAAQDTSVGRAQAWLIETCAAGNVRSRKPWRAYPRPHDLDMADGGNIGMELSPGSQLGAIFRNRAPDPVAPTAWNGAVIDGDVLVDVNQARQSHVEISIADLEFELKQSAPKTDSLAFPPTAEQGGRPSNRTEIEAEAERRLISESEKIPSSLAAFSRDLHSWLDKQTWAQRGARGRKVLSSASVEDHIRPLWRKYKGDRRR